MTPEGEAKRALLKRNGYYLTTPVGHSMEPMLSDRTDQALIVPLEGAPVRGDVLLYETPDGRHVLHRVVRVTAGGFLVRGDNCYDREPLLTPDRVIGRLEAFWHRGREVSCRDAGYRCYVRRRLFFYPARRFLSALKRLVRRVICHK